MTCKVFLFVACLAQVLLTSASSADPAVAADKPGISVPADVASPSEITVALPESKKLPSSPGFFRVTADVTVGQQRFPLAFALFLPASYFTTKEPMPLVVSLHNKGLEGSTAHALECEGITSLWAKDAWDTRDPNTKPGPTAIKIRSAGQFIGLAPQAPRGTALSQGDMPRVLAALIDKLRNAYQIDGDRIYLTGFSYGGSQTWLIAEQLPDLFAAIVPVSGRGTPDPAKTAKTLSHVPVYIGAGGLDSFFLACSTQMHDALIAAGHSRSVLHIVKNGNHFSYCSIYTDPTFWEWLLAQRRSQRPATRPVVASTGPTR